MQNDRRDFLKLGASIVASAAALTRGTQLALAQQKAAEESSGSTQAGEADRDVEGRAPRARDVGGARGVGLGRQEIDQGFAAADDHPAFVAG